MSTHAHFLIFFFTETHLSFHIFIPSRKKQSHKNRSIVYSKLLSFFDLTEINKLRLQEFFVSSELFLWIMMLWSFSVQGTVSTTNFKIYSDLQDFLI